MKAETRYIKRAWTGLLELLGPARDEQSITSILIMNGFLAFAGVFFAVAVLSLSHGKTATLWPVLGAWLVWVVGANARLLVKAHWAFGWVFKLTALLVFGGLACIALGLYNDLVIVGHWLLGR